MFVYCNLSEQANCDCGRHVVFTYEERHRDEKKKKARARERERNCRKWFEFMKCLENGWHKCINSNQFNRKPQ